MLAKIILFVSLAVCGVNSMKDVDSDIMTKIKNYQLCAACWGEDYAMAYMNSIIEASEKCGGASMPAPLNYAPLITYPTNVFRMPASTYNHFYNPHTTLGRKKRSAENIGPAEAFEYMGHMETMVGNFTCVMKELGLLNANGDVNTDVFAASSALDQINYTSGDKAGADPVFLKKFTTEMKQCHDISLSWPQEALNKNPFMQQHGRMALYFMCIKKAERESCAKYVMADYMEKFGINVNLPMAADKYDAANMAANIMKSKATKEMQHIDDYIWGDMDM